jgi:hypothetical protein
MSNNPKSVEEKMLKILNAWKTIAPDKVFADLTLAEFEIQVKKSLAPRATLKELSDLMMLQAASRESEDEITMQQLLCVVAGIIADPTEGINSALYEACGYIRKDSRKSGLTRKRLVAGKEKVSSRG